MSCSRGRSRRSALRYVRRVLSAGDARRFAHALLSDRRWSVLRALFDGPVVVATLKRRGLRPLVSHLPKRPPADVVEAGRISEAVDAGLAMWPIAFTCLRRSVVLLRELARCGLGADLHVGVRRGPDGIEAHAWLQVADLVINDDPELVQTYTRLTLGEAEALGLSFA